MSPSVVAQRGTERPHRAAWVRLPGPMALGIAVLASACATNRPYVGELPDVVDLPRATPERTAEDRPRVLVVVAHPDDELVFTGALYKTSHALGGACDLVTITDGQGGFKYATFAEVLHGIPLTDEDVGREHLPAIRRSEQLESARLLGLRSLYYLDQEDHRYTQDVAEVLGPDAEVWNLARVRARLDGLLTAGSYDFLLVHAPTRATHAHHQAATLLALEAVARMTADERPVALCAELETGDPDGPPILLSGESLAQLRSNAGPFVFDRTEPFGHRDRLDYRVIANAAIARHVSQGSMQLLIGRGDYEEYWIFDVSPEDAEARCAAWFAALAKPQFTKRVYDESAGTNAPDPTAPDLTAPSSAGNEDGG